MVNIDKQETQRNSAVMEKEGFLCTFETLRQELNVTEICTDAHAHISTFFSKWIYCSFVVVGAAVQLSA